jgi:hypothetical protein
MKLVILLLFNLTITSMALAQNGAGRGLDNRLDYWETVIPPSTMRTVKGCLFFDRASDSELDWKVYLDKGVPVGGPSASPPYPRRRHFPEIDMHVDNFRVAHAAQLVDDGWLIGFNQGEFGAALYWFSKDGAKSYKISDHQLEEFFEIGGQVYAIEGLIHRSYNRGSFIRIHRSTANGRWVVSTVLEFPSAPYAGVLGKNGTLYVVLSDGIFVVESAHKLVMVMPEEVWGGLYPNSAILSPDGSNLYIGMRQFVGKYDLKRKEFSLLIPDKDKINQKTSPEIEKHCRKLEDK